VGLQLGAKRRDPPQHRTRSNYPKSYQNRMKIIVSIAGLFYHSHAVVVQLTKRSNASQTEGKRFTSTHRSCDENRSLLLWKRAPHVDGSHCTWAHKVLFLLYFSNYHRRTSTPPSSSRRAPRPRRPAPRVAPPCSSRRAPRPSSSQRTRRCSLLPASAPLQLHPGERPAPPPGGRATAASPRRAPRPSSSPDERAAAAPPGVCAVYSPSSCAPTTGAVAGGGRYWWRWASRFGGSRQ
jgi:hypothetical protein